MTIRILTRTSLTATAALTLLLASGCAPAPSVPAGEAVQPSPTAATPSAETSMPQSPEEAFRTWLAASRAPDAVTACAYLNDALVERMLTAMKTSGVAVSGCAEMIEVTAQAYKAAGSSQEVEIQTLSHSASAAELHVTYLDGGGCGRVVLERGTSSWIITEQS